MDNKSRKALFITIITNTRSWNSTAFILDANFLIGKFSVSKFSSTKLVVQIKKVSWKLRECLHGVLICIFFSMTDQIEMSLFVLRYVTCLFIFLLGLKAPGIMQTIDYFSLNDPQRNFSPLVSLNIFCVYIFYFNNKLCDIFANSRYCY